MHNFLRLISHRSLANARLRPRVPLSSFFLFFKHAAIQTFRPVCYFKSFYLVTTDLGGERAEAVPQVLRLPL